MKALALHTLCDDQQRPLGLDHALHHREQGLQPAASPGESVHEPCIRSCRRRCPGLRASCSALAAMISSSCGTPSMTQEEGLQPACSWHKSNLGEGHKAVSICEGNFGTMPCAEPHLPLQLLGYDEPCNTGSRGRRLHSLGEWPRDESAAGGTLVAVLLAWWAATMQGALSQSQASIFEEHTAVQSLQPAQDLTTLVR